MEATTNFIVTNGNLWNELKYSVFKLLDWSVDNAVCVQLCEDGTVFINDCKISLQNLLTEKIGGHASGRSWFARDNSDVFEIIKVVTEWIRQPKK